LPKYIPDVLKKEPLEKPNGVRECEDAAERLRAAMAVKFEDG